MKEGDTHDVMIGEWVETLQRWTQTSLGVFGGRVVRVGLSQQMKKAGKKDVLDRRTVGVEDDMVGGGLDRVHTCLF